MRVGIYYHGVLHPESGGGFTFQNDIVRGIVEADSRHEICVISCLAEAPLPSGNERIKYVSLLDYDDNIILKFLKNATNRTMKRLFNRSFFEETSLLNKAVRENKIDLLWFISTRVDKVTVPYIMTVWDLAHRTYPYFPEVSVTGWKWEDRERHYKEFLPRAACIITGTEAGKEEVIKYYQVPEHIVKVVPFPSPSFFLNRGSSPSLTTSKNEFKLPDKYLFYPAQFWPHKNHVGLLSALKILKDNHGINFKLILAGSDRGNLDYIKDKIKELNLENDVNILGFVDTDYLVELYRNAFALVYTTFIGPDNLPPLEAFALGCPVIASNVSGAQEQLGDAALLFDPNNPEEIALHVKMLYDNPSKRGDMIKKGYSRAKQWTTADYIERVLSYVDDFEPIRRCWSPHNEYIHK